MPTPTIVYITTASKDEALTLGRALVEERLAACANVIPGLTSIYRWEGKITEDDETCLLIKTHSERIADVVARVKELHSYDCPCVVSLPIADGNPEFLDWILKETK